MTEKTFLVLGMHCDHCRAALERELETVSGVRQVDVDLGTERVTVRGEDFGDDDVRAAIESAGYEAA